jgi:hypothetical protein
MIGWEVRIAPNLITGNDDIEDFEKAIALRLQSQCKAIVCDADLGRRVLWEIVRQEHPRGGSNLRPHTAFYPKWEIFNALTKELVEESWRADRSPRRKSQDSPISR